MGKGKYLVKEGGGLGGGINWMNTVYKFISMNKNIFTCIY